MAKMTLQTLKEIEQSIKGYESPLIPTVRMLVRNVRALLKSEDGLRERCEELELKLKNAERARDEAYDKGRQEAYAAIGWRRASA
jgi:pyruvate formate-lyase activating enzyme-like uncharacterized protein